MFLSDQRVLTLLVFDLRQELDSPALVPVYRTDPCTGRLEVDTEESELTHLDFILLWLEVVHMAGRGRVRAGLSKAEGAGPEVVIVGSHAESLHSARDMQLNMVRHMQNMQIIKNVQNMQIMQNVQIIQNFKKYYLFRPSSSLRGLDNQSRANLSKEVFLRQCSVLTPWRRRAVW